MKKVVWALLDSRIGSIGQVRGILQAMDTSRYEINEKKIVYNKLAKLPNILKGRSLLGINKNAGDSLSDNFPDLLFSISRRTAPAARWIKKQSQGKTKIVQLMRINNFEAKDFDLVIVPQHDYKENAPQNFFYMTGSPHRVSLQALEDGRKKWASEFENLPKPWTTVIIGGSIKGKKFPIENAVRLGEEIKALHTRTGGSLFITDSRRTGDKARQAILEKLSGIPAYTYLWGEKKENPIMGFWALSDRIIVTGDSVSMCCESCGSGKPVLIFSGKGWLTRKHRRFVSSLYEGGYATALDDAGALEFMPKGRLDPAALIIQKIDSLFD